MVVDLPARREDNAVLPFPIFAQTLSRQASPLRYCPKAVKSHSYVSAIPLLSDRSSYLPLETLMIVLAPIPFFLSRPLDIAAQLLCLVVLMHHEDLVPTFIWI
jgi:hypothetical protein